MAVSAKVFGNFMQQVARGNVDWVDDDIVIALFDNTLSIDQDADVYVDDVGNYDTAEISTSGTGYSRITMSSKTDNYTSGTNTLSLDAADVTWSAATFTCRYALIFRELDAGSPDESTAVLIAYVDFGEDKPVSNGDFTITWDSEGVVKSVAA